FLENQWNQLAGCVASGNDFECEIAKWTKLLTTKLSHSSGELPTTCCATSSFEGNTETLFCRCASFGASTQCSNPQRKRSSKLRPNWTSSKLPSSKPRFVMLPGNHSTIRRSLLCATSNPAAANSSFNRISWITST